MARQADERDLGALSVSLARRALRMALENESEGEAQHKQVLRQLLSSPQSQALALALTDRAHRSRDAKTTVAAIVEVARKIGVDENLPLLDRAQLRALLSFGSAVPRVTAEAMRARLHREASPFVLDARGARLEQGLRRIRTAGRRVNLNYLGEEVLGEREAQRRVEKYLELVGRSDVDALSVKLSGSYSQINLLAPSDSARIVAERLTPVLLRARDHKKLVYFDMEAFRDLEVTVRVVTMLSSRPELREAELGIALQAYLPDTGPVVEQLLALADQRRAQGGAPLRVRLVKGANLAAETVEASLHRLACPVFGTKLEVDANYKRLLERILRPEHRGKVSVGLGSHNLFDQCYGLLLAEHRGLGGMLELEMLEGMAGAIGRVLTKLAGGALLYAPTVLPDQFPSAVSYLVRRLDENTAPENFLQASVSMRPGDAAFGRESQSFLQALALAEQSCEPTRRVQDRTQLPALRVRTETRVFDNVEDTDWTRPWNREALAAALARAQGETREISSRVAGQALASGRVLCGTDPSLPGHTAYRVHLAGPRDVERAIEVGFRAEKPFADVASRIRALMLERVADELEKSRLELIALMVQDAGKRAQEADIEVSEAIDFARYYAQSFLDHEERLQLAPRGLCVITPPFNFPLAIPLGGALAALVAGNPVILKPAPETPLVAWAAVECCYRAGVPTDALCILLCEDEHASPLICDERVKTVVLTGASGTARAFLRMRPGLRLLAETGGKNGIYVSALSDRDAAIGHIVRSAFGHAGQKCSALSQLILEEEVFEDRAFRDTLLDASASLTVGSAWDLSSFVTPLIRKPEGALARILARNRADLGGAEFLLEPRADPKNEQLLSPGVLWGVSPGSFPHTTEFFGPVLSVLSASDFAHGMEILNGTPYGLTAGFFGLSETQQEKFVATADAGNLYLNRGITGAVVGRQPFGGRKSSNFGSGAKAGGPNYVLSFCHVSRRANAPPAISLTKQPGTAVVGEENFLRYQPGETLTLICPDAREADIDVLRTARQLAGAPDRETFLRAPFDEASLEVLAPEGPQRIRVVGTPPDELVLVAAARGWSLLTDPVCADPSFEALNYLMEQAISVAYHRHGNVSLGRYHPLVSSD